jgi:hypothetical protein
MSIIAAIIQILFLAAIQATIYRKTQPVPELHFSMGRNPHSHS